MERKKLYENMGGGFEEEERIDDIVENTIEPRLEAQVYENKTFLLQVLREALENVLVEMKIKRIIGMNLSETVQQLINGDPIENERLNSILQEDGQVHTRVSKAVLEEYERMFKRWKASKSI